MRMLEIFREGDLMPQADIREERYVTHYISATGLNRHSFTRLSLRPEYFLISRFVGSKQGLSNVTIDRMTTPEAC